MTFGAGLDARAKARLTKMPQAPAFPVCFSSVPHELPSAVSQHPDFDFAKANESTAKLEAYEPAI